VSPRSAGAQDLEFIAALERAQSARPAHLTSTARIAPETDPGDPLVVQGRPTALRVRREGSVQHVDYVFRIQAKNKF
jgi:hypothetical protein